MKQTVIFCLFYSFFLISAKAQQNSETIKIDFITKIPSIVDGCSGLYTYDTTSLKKKKYVIVTNLQEVGFIKIQGKEIKLTVTEQKELSRNSFRTVFKGGGYVIVLTTKSLKQVDELSSETGTVEITRGKVKIVIKIHGESGC